MASKVSLRDKLIMRDTYEQKLAEGEHRDDILDELSQQYHKDPRQIERYLSEVSDFSLADTIALIRRWSAELHGIPSPQQMLEKMINSSIDRLVESCAGAETL